MNPLELIAVFEKIKHLRVGVIGDFAVDFFFNLQTRTGEFWVETPKVGFWAIGAKASLGGAGNVVQNLSALGVQHLKVFGCVGDDVFGREIQHLFRKVNVNIDALQILSNGWDTCTYTKPMSAEGEENRLDFGTDNVLSENTFEQMVRDLEAALPQLDVLIINQQFANPLLNPSRINALNRLSSRFPNCQVLADLRDFGGNIRGATLKVNTDEIARILKVSVSKDLGTCITQSRQLQAIIKAPVLITRGEKGILYVDKDETCQVRVIPLEGPLDTVGAGDTVVAAFAAARGVNSSIFEALQIANLAAVVTVQKLQQTGTACLEEILEVIAVHKS